MSDLELRLLKFLYKDYRRSKTRSLHRAVNVHKTLGLQDGTDISTLHDSSYFSIALDGTHDAYQISSQGIRKMDIRRWKILGFFSLTLVVIVLFMLGVRPNSVQLGILSYPLSFTNEESEITRNGEMMREAKEISNSITVTGWEDPGDYIGDLSKITSFYSKYKDVYPVEFETYSRQLTDWQDRLKKKSDSGETIWAADKDGLMGLVRSGDNHLEEIANSEDGVEGQ